MDCLSPEQIELLCENSVGDPERVAWLAHIEECGRCRLVYEEYSANREMILRLQNLSPAVASSTDSVQIPPELIEGYRIVRQIGIGGQAVVYEAVQEHTKQTVALKLLKEGLFASEHSRHRFEREMEIAAHLKHPNVVTVYHAGISHGYCYLVMDYIDGQPLNKYLQAHPCSVEQKLRLFIKIGEAVSYAHRHGVIHRDLTPRNILVDADGEPHIVDFGLARREKLEDLVSVPAFTRIGVPIGTLAYMSPEQARGDWDTIDIRTDVYSLGVILYEMLSSRYPYTVVGQMAEVLRNIAEASPERPSTIDRRINNEIETIVLRCLAKEPPRRYQSAGELAADVARYLLGEPIEAKRDSRWYVFRKTIRRYKAVVSITSCFIALIITAAVTFKIQANTNKQLAVSEAEANKTAQRRLYANQISMASISRQLNDTAKSLPVLEQCEEKRRGWEWRLLRFWADSSSMTMTAHTGPVNALAFSPDGKLFASAGNDRAVIIWDSLTKNPVVTFQGHEGWITSLIFFHDGQRIATGGYDDCVYIWNYVTHSQERLKRDPFNGPVTAIACSTDGTQLAVGTGHGDIQLWAIASKKGIRTFCSQGGWIHDLAFSPDGKYLVCGRDDGRVEQWNISSGKPKTISALGGEPILCLAVNHAGNLIAMGGASGKIAMWDAAQESVLPELSGHSSRVRRMCFLPNGNTLVSAGDDGVTRLWYMDTTRSVATLPGHTVGIRCLAMKPDGTSIVTGDFAGNIKSWLLGVNHPMPVVSWNVPKAGSLSLNPQGTILATAGSDFYASLWDCSTGQYVGRTGAKTGGELSSIVFAGDNKVFSGGDDGVLRGWRISDGQPAFVSVQSIGDIRSIAVSPDTRQLAWGGNSDSLMLLDLRTGRTTSVPLDHHAPVESLAYSPDGKFLASAGQDGNVWVYEAATGKHVITLLNSRSQPLSCVTYSLDSLMIVASDDDGYLTAWDASSGQQKHTLPAHRSAIRSISFCRGTCCLITVGRDNSMKAWEWPGISRAKPPFEYYGSAPACAYFSADGSLAACGNEEGQIRVYDTKTGQELHRLKGHYDDIKCVSFNSNATQLASCGEDAVVRVWDIRSGQIINSWGEHAQAVKATAFNPSGEKLVTGGSDRTARVWDTRTGKEVAVYGDNSLGSQTAAGVSSVAYQTDGRLLFTGHQDGTVRVWNCQTGKIAGTVVKCHDRISCLISCGNGLLASGDDSGVISFLSPHDQTVNGTYRAESGIRCMAHAGENNLLAAGLADGRLILLDAGFHRQIAALSGHAGAVTEVVFVQNGRRMVSGSEDGTIRIWDVDYREPLLIIDNGKRPVADLAATLDGGRIAALSAEGTVSLWTVPLELPGQACVLIPAARSAVHTKESDASSRLGNWAKDRIKEAMGVEILSFRSPWEVTGINADLFADGLYDETVARVAGVGERESRYAREYIHQRIKVMNSILYCAGYEAGELYLEKYHNYRRNVGGRPDGSRIRYFIERARNEIQYAGVALSMELPVERKQVVEDALELIQRLFEGQIAPVALKWSTGDVSTKALEDLKLQGLYEAAKWFASQTQPAQAGASSQAGIPVSKPSASTASTKAVYPSPLVVSAAAGDVQAVENLLHSVADGEQLDDNGQNAMCAAAGAGRLEIVQILLRKGVRPDARNADGSTALMWACERGHIPIVEALLSAGADYRARNKINVTPMHWAANAPIAKMLLEKGADINAQDIHGWFPMHVAASQNRVDVVKFLLDHDSAVDARTTGGSTPLHIAAREGRVDAVQLLISRHADTEARTIGGNTPVDLARQKGHAPIVKLFEEYAISQRSLKHEQDK